jgi:hypothetical protein
MQICSFRRTRDPIFDQFMGDVPWRDNLGNTSIWFMNGVSVSSTGAVGNIPTNWALQAVNSE